MLKQCRSDAEAGDHAHLWAQHLALQLQPAKSHCSIAAPGGPSVQGTEMETLKNAIGAAHGCAAHRELHIPLQWWKELHGATFVPGHQAWGMVA